MQIWSGVAYLNYVRLRLDGNGVSLTLSESELKDSETLGFFFFEAVLWCRCITWRASKYSVVPTLLRQVSMCPKQKWKSVRMKWNLANKNLSEENVVTLHFQCDNLRILFKKGNIIFSTHPLRSMAQEGNKVISVSKRISGFVGAIQGESIDGHNWGTCTEL